MNRLAGCFFARAVARCGIGNFGSVASEKGNQRRDLIGFPVIVSMRNPPATQSELNAFWRALPFVRPVPAFKLTFRGLSQKHPSTTG